MDDGRDAVSQRGCANDGRPIHRVAGDELRSRAIMPPAGYGGFYVPAQGADLPALADEPGGDGAADAAGRAENEGGPVGRGSGNRLNHEESPFDEESFGPIGS